MTKLAFNLPVILLLAAVTTPTCAQDAAPRNQVAHSNGCVDFSAEYTGCWTFGSPLEVQANARRDRLDTPDVQVDVAPDAPATVLRIVTSSLSKTPRHTKSTSPTIDAWDSTADVGIALGLLGVP